MWGIRIVDVEGAVEDGAMKQDMRGWGGSSPPPVAHLCPGGRRKTVAERKRGNDEGNTLEEGFAVL